MTEWWSEQVAIWIGALGGSGIGVIGGCFGSIVGYLAPRGKARRAVLTIHAVLIMCGLASLAAALVALALGQPRHVFLPLMGGTLLALVMGPLYPVVRMRYREAERRRMDANLLRDG